MKRMIDKIAQLLYVCLWVGAVLFSGCSSKVELDTSLMTGEPCAPPCWHNIVPGVSTQSDVRAQLENSPLVKAESLSYHLSEYGGIQLFEYTWQARSKVANRIFFKGDRVLRINIRMDDDVTLGDVVDKYGPPETIYVDRGPEDISRYYITCDYPSMGLRIKGYTRIKSRELDELVVDDTVWLSEDAKITEAIYHAPMPLPDALSQAFLLSPEEVEYLMGLRQPWQGFGYVKFF